MSLRKSYALPPRGEVPPKLIPLKEEIELFTSIKKELLGKITVYQSKNPN